MPRRNGDRADRLQPLRAGSDDPLGIDIAVKQPRETSNVVPLVVTLVGREVGVPDWAKGTPLYFDPRASRVA